MAGMKTVVHNTARSTVTLMVLGAVCVPVGRTTNRPAKYEWKIRDQPTKADQRIWSTTECDRPMTSNESQTKEAYDSDEWSTGQRGLDGGLATGQAEFDVPRDEHEPQVEPERNPGGLLSDEREQATGETEQATLFEPPADEQRDDGQQGLGGFDASGAEIEADEWGPTMDRPVPIEERQSLPGTDRDRRELPGTDLAPSDFELVSGAMSPRAVVTLGYHPDDRIWPKEHDKHGEAMARAEALEQAARPRQYERGDR